MDGRIDTSRLALQWSEAPWDTAIFGSPVFQIENIEVRASGAEHDFQEFEQVRDRAGSRLVSCRMTGDQLRESFFLEGRGFRFIEEVLRPDWCAQGFCLCRTIRA